MALQKVGLMAVVEGVSDFIADVDKINQVIDRLRPSSSWLIDIFKNVSDALNDFGEKIVNVATIALGIMLRDAIEWLIGKLGDIAKAAFEAGNEFQLMGMRLQGFNLQDAIDSGLEYDEAMAKAIEVTKEQMTWIMKLAATTPFDATDIAQVYTLSKSYGFSNAAAEQMTDSILNFTAAMGLSGTEAERLIVNLGQMAQRGKITTREMNDLARGAFVPIRDILDRISVKMGITTGELTKLIQKPGGGVDYQLFIDAFNEMVAQEARFQDGAVRMAHTFKGAWENITQTIRDVIGGFIFLPGILDPLGKALGDIMDVVGERWGEIEAVATRVGLAIQPIVERLLGGYLPKGDTIVDMIVNGLDSLADWLENPFNTIKIYEFFYTIQGYVADVRNWVVDDLIPAFNTIRDWVSDNGSTIKEFFKSLGDIVSGAFSSLFGGGGSNNSLNNAGRGKVTSESGLDRFLETIKNLMQWIIDHKDDLEKWAGVLLQAYINFLLIQAVLYVLLDLLAMVFKLITSSQFWFDLFAVNLSLTLTDTKLAKEAIENGKWDTIGSLIVDKIILGVLLAGPRFYASIINMIANALSGAQGSLGGTLGGSGTGGRSNPGGGGTESATGTTSGGSIGSKTGGSWTKSSGQSSISTSSKNVATTNNFNLTVHTQATKENITSDFRTLAALNNYAT